MLVTDPVPRMRPVLGTHPCLPVITEPLPARMNLRHPARRGMALNLSLLSYEVDALSGKNGEILGSRFRGNDAGLSIQVLESDHGFIQGCHCWLAQQCCFIPTRLSRTAITDIILGTCQIRAV